MSAERHDGAFRRTRLSIPCSCAASSFLFLAGADVGARLGRFALRPKRAQPPGRLVCMHFHARCPTRIAGLACTWCARGPCISAECALAEA